MNTKLLKNFNSMNTLFTDFQESENIFYFEHYFEINFGRRFQKKKIYIDRLGYTQLCILIKKGGKKERINYTKKVIKQLKSINSDNKI